MIRRVLDIARDCAGTVAIEFALVIPVLLTILLGIVQFSLVFNNISVLTNAAAAGATVFSGSRGFTPYSSAVTSVQTAAGSLTTANLTITTTVNGAACASDAGCNTAFGTSGGMPATVTVSYPCPLVFSAATLAWIGINTSAFCPLQSSMTEIVQ
jgi:Flp pilus assembly protein TadG